MSDARASDGKYHIEIRDARGVVIGDNNVVYQYFLDERYRPLAEHLIAFDDLIAERTADFVGRAFLDARLAAFMEQHDRGYFVLVGEPGIGKTAWAAHVVREYQALHHFNVSAMGIVRPDQCLENLCAQIIARVQLDQPYLPVNAGRDGSLLDKLLRQAAERLDGRKLVVVIDALDEAQMPADVRGTNALYLPSSLPVGVYFVLTRRPQPVSLETAPGTPSETFTLGAELPDNQADVRAYLHQQAGIPEFAARLADRRIPAERFVEELVARSAGNFMYLAYLLPDVAAGLFDPLDLAGLPHGLRDYYERFWNELQEAKGEGRDIWIKFYKPVIGMLAAAREPVSAAWIGRILGLDSDEVADFALERWQKFLSRTEIGEEVLWRVYHVSFVDFISEKLDDVRQYHDYIANYYCLVWSSDVSRLPERDMIYGLRNLASHLAQAQRWEDLHRLVAEGDSVELPWAQAHFKYEKTYRHYLADLALAWKRSDEDGCPSATAIGRQIRYAIIKSTIHALSCNIPPILVGELVRLGAPGWTPAAALDYVQTLTRSGVRADALVELAPLLPSPMIPRALELARQLISWPAVGDYARAIAGLAPYLSSDLAARALHFSESFDWESDKVRVIEALASRLPPDVMVSSYAQAIAMKEKGARARAMAALASHLAPPQRNEALCAALDAIAAASDGISQNDRFDALTILAPHLLPEQLGQALMMARNPYRWSGKALAALIPRLSSALLEEVLRSAVSCAGDWSGVRTLTDLLPFFPAEHRGQAIALALSSARQLSDSATRVVTIAAQARYLTPEQLLQAFADAVAVQKEDMRSGALEELAPYLPDTLIQDAWETARLISNDSDRSNVIIALMPRLPSSILCEVLSNSH